MGWITMSARRANLIDSVNQHSYEVLNLNRQKRQLSNFANAVGDGSFSPNEISSLGVDLFGTAINYMETAHIVASELAQRQVDEYMGRCQNWTNEDLVNNGLGMYTNADGVLDEQLLYAKFYEEELKEYAEEEIKPALNEIELSIENQQNELNMLLESEKAELETLKGSISESIRNSAVNISV